MLIEQTIDKLTALQLHGVVAALQQWLDRPADHQLKPTDLAGLLADAEWTYRENRKLTTRLRQRASASPPASRTSTTATHAASPSRSCSSSPPRAGSLSTRP